MDSLELHDRKVALEREILATVARFEKETNTAVTYVNVDRVTVATYGDSVVTIIANVHCIVEVE